MSGQAEIPDVPRVGLLKRLREIVPTADRILEFAKLVEMSLERSDGAVARADSRAVATMRRACEKRLDAFGIPRKHVRTADDFPIGTREVAAASKPFWEALEVSMSAIAYVMAAEKAAYPKARAELKVDRVRYAARAEDYDINASGSPSHDGVGDDPPEAA